MAKARGKTKSVRGPRGHRGAQGQQGEPGRQGDPGISPEALERIIRTLESVQREAEIQFRRIAQIQAQVDGTLKALKDMGDSAGRHRRKGKGR